MKKITCLLLSLVLVLSLLLPCYADSDSTESTIPDSTTSESLTAPDAPKQIEKPKLPHSSGKSGAPSEEAFPARKDQA